jgi:hypothetical protein
MVPALIGRRRVLALGVAAAALPLFGPFPFAYAANRRDLSFRALWKRRSVGRHSVTFRPDGDRVTVETHIEVVIKVLFSDVFRLLHDGEEIWHSGRLVSIASTTEADGARFQVSGTAVQSGFRIVGPDGPFLAAAGLLTSDSIWDSRIVHETRLIDVQHGSEIGLVARPLGNEKVDTPQRAVLANRYQMITPHYAGSVFYDEDQRWVKALIEFKGQTIEYVLAT